MSETIRESIADSLACLASGQHDRAHLALLYALGTLNAAERAEDGRRLVYDWDDETVADQLPATLDPEASWRKASIVHDWNAAISEDQWRFPRPCMRDLNVANGAN